MYTQCNNCHAIFKVTMKELTSAQGLLRCGECGSTFDAMKTLSTTLPDDRKFLNKKKDKEVILDNAEKPVKKRKIYLTPLAKARHELPKNTPDASYQLKRKHKTHSTKFLLIALLSLSLLLTAQIIYKQKDWLAENSLTSGLTRAFCKAAGCIIEKKRDLSKISLINKNIYSHPNQPNSLVISASLENKATFDQPFPLIEISLLDSKSQIIALRRFMPKEYLNNKYQTDLLMTLNNPIELKLNIADPGKDAVRFQFKFL